MKKRQKRGLKNKKISILSTEKEKCFIIYIYIYIYIYDKPLKFWV